MSWSVTVGHSVVGGILFLFAEGNGVVVDDGATLTIPGTDAGLIIQCRRTGLIVCRYGEREWIHISNRL